MLFVVCHLRCDVIGYEDLKCHWCIFLFVLSSTVSKAAILDHTSSLVSYAKEECLASQWRNCIAKHVPLSLLWKHGSQTKGYFRPQNEKPYWSKNYSKELCSNESKNTEGLISEAYCYFIYSDFRKQFATCKPAINRLYVSVYSAQNVLWSLVVINIWFDFLTCRYINSQQTLGHHIHHYYFHVINVDFSEVLHHNYTRISFLPNPNS